MSIALLIPMCSRNQSWNGIEDCYFLRSFLPRFELTKSASYKYTFYLGVDDDDAFFLRHESHLTERGFKVINLTGCQHAPAQAWNQLFEVAVKDGHEYFFQVGDDVILQSRKWTERFIEVLQTHNNKGVVGPCHPSNFWARRRNGRDPVIENAFVHKSHYDIFGSFFPANIKNWYCDDWMTQVYKPICSYTCEDIIVQNQCVDNRYVIEHLDISSLVAEGHKKIIESLKGCFSFCVFGDQDKYRKGLLKNIEIIHQYYPSWDIVVYTSPDCMDFIKSDVKIIPTGDSGYANLLYRFKPLFDNYDIVCVRDADSRVHERDRWCIQDFIVSPFTAYTIRDHPFHTYPIMGGLFGIKKGHPMFSMRDLNKAIETPCQYTTDTTFLETNFERKNIVVYSYNSSGVTNTNETTRVIPTPIQNQEFCGQVMLFRDGEEYCEFTHPENITTNG